MEDPNGRPSPPEPSSPERSEVEVRTSTLCGSSGDAMSHFDLEPLQEPELLQAFHVRRSLFAVGALIGFGAFAGILAEDLVHRAWPGLSLLSAGMLGVLGIAFSTGLVMRAPPF